MGDRLVHGAVALAVVASAGLIGLLVAAPFVPQPEPARPAASTSPSPSASVAAGVPPIGLFALRGPLHSGTCIALELSARSYPIAPEAPSGEASVQWWRGGMTGCDTRSGDVATVPASVDPVADEDAPDGPPVGYRVQFAVPAGSGAGSGAGTDAPEISVELTILARQSTQALIQAVETASGTGSGLVFDRVDAIDPELVPLPSETPVSVGPNGLFVLEGRFGPDGPCLVLDLGPESYPAEPNGQGQAVVRWWEPATPDPDDPAQCLRRAGDVLEVEAVVVRVASGDAPGGPPVAFAMMFAVPTGGGDAPGSVEIHIPLATATRDALDANAVLPDGVGALSFYRVDSIDPPLGPSPSASPGG